MPRHSSIATTNQPVSTWPCATPRLMLVALVALILSACGTSRPPVTEPVTSPSAPATATGQPFVAVTPAAGLTPGVQVTFLGQLRATNGEPFERVTRLATDGQGGLYLLDTNRHRVLKYDAERRLLAAWGSQGREPGQFEFRVAGGFGGGIAADAKGNVYVADALNRVQRFDADGQVVAIWGREGSRPGELSRPLGLAVAPDGHLYVADGDNHRVQKFDATGAFVTTWGRQGLEIGEFQRPSAIALDGRGHVYVADQLQRVQKFDAAGRPLAIWGVRGLQPAEFAGNIHLAVDGQGAVYVSDGNGHRVQVFDPDGNFIALWGNQGDGPGQFSFAGGIAVDNRGLIHVADILNLRVQSFALSAPWPLIARGTPTPRPPTPTVTPVPTPTAAPQRFMTPVDR